jgi:hypothetical protein
VANITVEELPAPQKTDLARPTLAFFDPGGKAQALHANLD